MTIELAENDIRDAFRDVTFERPVSKIIAGARRRQHRRRIAFGAIPALGLTAAWGTTFLTSDDLRIEAVSCYDSGPDDPNFGLITPPTTGGSPESVCAALWAGGHMRNKRGVVPPLTACVMTRDSVGMRRGNVGVFPTAEEDFCSRPGLQPLPEDYLDRVVPFVEMIEDLRLAIGAAAVSDGGSEEKACLSDESAVEIVAEALQSHGYNDWTVQLGAPDQFGPCWTDVSFDTEAREAWIFSNEPGLEAISVY